MRCVGTHGEPVDAVGKVRYVQRIGGPATILGPFCQYHCETQVDALRMPGPGWVHEVGIVPLDYAPRSADAVTVAPSRFGGSAAIRTAKGVTLTLSRNVTEVADVVHVYGYRYPYRDGTRTVTAKSFEDAIKNIGDLRENLGIHATLVWREVSVSVTDWI